MRIFKLTSFLSALLVTAALTAPTIAPAQISVGINITVAPPAIPVYVQPPLPAVGYMWIPGSWQWGDDGYFWVPGTWVEPPTAGLLWTPGYWGWNNGVFAWNAGYWGPHIGFYGGVNYGFGYGGVGFAGGEWRNGGFFYNRSVVNIGTNVHVTNVYNKTVIVNETNVTRVSYNGGEGGLKAAPTAEERTAMQEHHTPPTAEQEKNVTAAKSNPALRASANHGKPAVAATAKPGVFKGKGVVAAKSAGAPFKAETPAKPTAHPPAASHENVAHPAPAKPAAKAAKPAAKPAEAKPEEPKPEAKTEEPKPEAKPEEAKPAAKPAAPKPAARPAAPRPAAAKPAPKPAPKPEEKKE